ncbi:MAG: DUF411 domain-containing protein [Pseudomonadota bacterium]
MIRILMLSILLGSAAVPAVAQEKTEVTLYRNPNCSCCLDYAEYLRVSGFEVTVDSKQDLAVIRKQLHVPEQFEGCHVSAIGKYAVEGHVSAGAIKKLLAEHPVIVGISIPGMPAGTPGMTGRKTGPLPVYEIASDGVPAKVFATE